MDDRELLKVVMGIVGQENCLDDCAELPCGDQVMVVTTDMLHQTTDFVPGMSDWQRGALKIPDGTVKLNDISYWDLSLQFAPGADFTIEIDSIKVLPDR